MTGGTTEYVNAHCHVDLYDSPQDILKTVETNRIHTIAVTNAPFVFDFTHNLAAGSTYLHAAVGMHPELVAEHGNRLDEIWAHIPQTKFVGEIGLDYVTQDESLRERQRAAFRRILDFCATSGDKVITVHSRRSASDVIDMIGASYPGCVILHWFSGTKRELQRAIDFGFYFSVNQSMFVSKSGGALIRSMPKERILTETDGPFTKEQSVPARPDTVIRTCLLLDSLWNLEPGEAAAVIRTNFHTVTGLS